MLTFEVLKKSSKEFHPRSGSTEFFFLTDSLDTFKSDFVAQVKLKGEDITVFDLYFRLRRESQTLGANSFRIVNKAKGGDSYYLLCNIYLTDTALLNKEKRNDPDNGKIFIISPEPVKYLNKDPVSINDKLKFDLISGTHYTIFKKGSKDSLVHIKSKKSEATFRINDPEVKYYTTRYFTTFSVANFSNNTPDIDDSVKSIKATIPLNTEIRNRYKATLKNKDGSVEAAFGKMLLLFSKAVDIKQN